MSASRQVDKNAIKVGQGISIILLLLAFVLNAWVIAAFVAFAQLAGALNLPFAPYKLLYENVVKPNGWVKPHVITDNPEPHRFAMLVASLFDGVGALLVAANVPLIGWSLIAIVIVLANLNVWVNFCAGCWMYYLFNRLGVPGFAQSPVS